MIQSAVLMTSQIVLDDEDRVALVHQRVQHLQQLAHILEMQPGRRLVEDIDRAASRPPAPAPFASLMRLGPPA